MSESIMVRMNGGPVPGTRIVSIDVLEWPPPEGISVSPSEQPGSYRLRNYSQLPPQTDPESRLMRGAEYDWTPSAEPER